VCVGCFVETDYSTFLEAAPIKRPITHPTCRNHLPERNIAIVGCWDKFSGVSETVSSILHEAYDEPLGNIILVHGALDRGMAFRGVVQRLGDYDTTVYDRRGYGASLGMALAASLNDHVDDLVVLMDGKPTILIGHSYGGVVSMLTAARHPELVSVLGVFEPPIPGIVLPTDLPGPHPEPPEDPEHLVRWMYRRVVGESAFERMGEHARKALIDEAPALKSDLANVRDMDPPFDPSSVPMPTLVGYGGESIPRHIARAQWLAENLPQGSLMEALDAAHPAHRTHPEQFVAFIKATIALAD
jgi:pimeloyl-ACP methyl ester carboxylesterase